MPSADGAAVGGPAARRSRRASGDAATLTEFRRPARRAASARRSQIVLGLDPDPARLWPRAARARGPARPDEVAPAARSAPAARAVRGPLPAGDRGGRASSAWPSSPRWRASSASGRLAGRRCTRSSAAPPSAGLLVIADAKRGDIDVSADAPTRRRSSARRRRRSARCPGLGADALTVNPLLGRDSLAPLVDGRSGARRGPVRAGADLQSRAPPTSRTASSPPAAPSATAWPRWSTSSAPPESASVGLSDVGAVVGATAPERLERAARAMPHAPFLLPGVGAQGGRVQDLAAGLRARPGRRPGLGLARDRQRAPSRPAATRRRPPARRRRACASWRGAWRLTVACRRRLQARSAERLQLIAVRSDLGAGMIALRWWRKARASLRRSPSPRWPWATYLIVHAGLAHASLDDRDRRPTLSDTAPRSASAPAPARRSSTSSSRATR